MKTNQFAVGSATAFCVNFADHELDHRGDPERPLQHSACPLHGHTTAVRRQHKYRFGATHFNEHLGCRLCIKFFPVERYEHSVERAEANRFEESDGLQRSRSAGQRPLQQSETLRQLFVRICVWINEQKIHLRGV